jgi:hypothetical protein
MELGTPTKRNHTSIRGLAGVFPPAVRRPQIPEFWWRRGLKTNNPADQEKAIVYNELVANAVAAQTVNDLTHALNKLHDRGINIAAEDLAHFSPYPTSKVKRFGDYPAQVSIDSRPIRKHLPASSVSMGEL